MHETEGVKIAEKILTGLNYDQENILEILAIIDGHDTRQAALSLNYQALKILKHGRWHGGFAGNTAAAEASSNIPWLPAICVRFLLRQPAGCPHTG